MKDYLKHKLTLGDIINKKHNEMINSGYVLDNYTLRYTYEGDDGYTNCIKYSHFVSMCELEYEDSLREPPAVHHNCYKINSLVENWYIIEGEPYLVDEYNCIFGAQDIIINVNGWSKHAFQANDEADIDGLSDKAKFIVGLITPDIKTGLALVDLRSSNVVTLLNYLKPIFGYDIIAKVKDVRSKQDNTSKKYDDLFEEDDDNE